MAKVGIKVSIPVSPTPELSLASLDLHTFGRRKFSFLFQLLSDKLSATGLSLPAGGERCSVLLGAAVLSGEANWEGREY